MDVNAVDESRLWLPSSHEKLYLKLKAAAETAESLERCQTILRGTIDFEQGTSDQPIFRFLCRQPNGRTYNELIDGLTARALTTLDETAENPHEEKESEEKIRESRRKAVEQEKIAFQTRCYQKIQEKISLFNNIQVYRDDNPIKHFEYEYIDEEFVVHGIQAKYQKDFDALDIEGRALEYRVICELEGQNDRVSIKKRIDESV